MMNAQQTFITLQAKYQAEWTRYQDLRAELRAKYGDYEYAAPLGKRNKVKAAQDRAFATSDKFFAHLDTVSPRDWRNGAPAHWILTELTWDDAITSGPLSVTPPPYWGSTPHASRLFASAIR